MVMVIVGPAAVARVSEVGLAVIAGAMDGRSMKTPGSVETMGAMGSVDTGGVLDR